MSAFVGFTCKYCWRERPLGKVGQNEYFLVKQKLYRMFDFTLTAAPNGNIPSLASFYTRGRSKGTSQECITAMWWTEARCFVSRIFVSH